MTTALSALSTSSSRWFGPVQFVAEAILQSSKEGERDPAVLARMALLGDYFTADLINVR